MFVESYGYVQKKLVAQNLADTGFSFLVLSYLQVDISGGIGLNENAIDNFISCGLSIRLPN